MPFALIFVPNAAWRRTRSSPTATTWIASLLGSHSAGCADFHKPRLGELADYLEFLRDEQLAPASVARHLAALKMLYRFLKLEERRRSIRGGAARFAGLMGAHPDCAVAGKCREAVAGAAASRSLLPPRSGVAGNALCHRLPRFGGRESQRLPTCTSMRSSAKPSARGASSGSCRWALRQSTPCAPISERNGRECPRGHRLSTSS